jgi:murein DD-endopeptidase MepM/ murein hydrolase activator NlpD
VRAVFGGTVIKVTNIDGVVVMISHGEFFTVYSNLSAASVQSGQKVAAKQTIGTAGQNSDGDNMINFQIWKVGSNNALSTVNPADWIAK